MDFLHKYEPFKWYPVDDDMYWFDNEEYSIIVHCTYSDKILTEENCPLGWGTMCKTEGYKFMIISKK